MIRIKKYQGIGIIHCIMCCFFLILLGVFSGPAHAAGTGLAKTLSVNVQVTVQWKDEVPSFHKNEGSMTLNIGGSLKLERGGSPEVHKQNMTFMPVLTYRAQSLNVIYKYDETMTSLGPPPPKGCRDPIMFEFHGSGASQVVEGSSLNIRYFNTMVAPYLDNLSPDEKNFLANMQGSPLQCDYYEFFTGGPYGEVTIPGTITKTEDERCEYEATDKPLKVFRVGIRSALPKSGSMSGSKTWSADNRGMCPPSFGISVCNLPAPICPSPCHPSEGGKSNVTYSLSWNIGRAEEVIFVREPEEKKDEKRPCRIIQNRILQTKVISKLYENPNIRKFIEERYPDQTKPNDMRDVRLNKYQEIIENLFLDIMEDTHPSDWADFDGVSRMIDTLSDDQINDALRSIDRGSGGGGTQTNMMADASIHPDDPCKWDNLGINANLNGKMVRIIDMINAESVNSLDDARIIKTRYYPMVQGAYAADYFDCQQVGLALFEATLAHEMTHARQYIKNGCFPRSIEELSQYEQEAYKVEMDKLKEYLMEWGC
jgi:hypothetical protein